MKEEMLLIIHVCSVFILLTLPKVKVRRCTVTRSYGRVVTDLIGGGG